MEANNGRINSFGSVDDLTGLFDRGFLEGRLPVEIQRCRQQGQPLAIVIADIDFFRVINENCSPTAGDLVLRHFGQMLRGAPGSREGWAARFGGEEFLLCLPGCSRDEAAAVAERLRQALEDSAVDYRGIQIKLTASFGVGAVTEFEGDRDLSPGSDLSPSSLTPQELAKVVQGLLADAESRLAAAKAGGRNQVRA